MSSANYSSQLASYDNRIFGGGYGPFHLPVPSPQAEKGPGLGGFVWYYGLFPDPVELSLRLLLLTQPLF